MSTPVLPRPAAVERMSRRLTAPFAAGGDVLPLVLAPGGTGAVALVAAYDFTDHQARYGVTPQPSYVLYASADVTADTVVTVRVEGQAIAGGGADVPVIVAAGTLAGGSVVVPLPPGADAMARVSRITVATADGPATSPPAEQAWTLTALLGTMARLLWVLGGKRDTLRRQMERTAAQRRLGDATGASLDLIGSDLAVPRFPPLPYPFDADTVALYHLDEPAGAASLEDFAGRFPGRVAHDGVPDPVVLCGSTGRFGPGVQFAAGGAIRVASSGDLDVAAAASATAECFVRPDPATGDGLVIGRRAGADGGAPTGPGWTIEVGEFGRGLPRSVHATVASGMTVQLYAEISLPTDRFTHLALTLDRGTSTLTLRVDGMTVQTADASSLGALDPAADLVIGPGSTGFRGWVDEVRISRVARSAFNPVLGEADEAYRRRLNLFRQWVLPTPGTLATVLNAAVGEIGGQPDALAVDDTDAPMVRGTSRVRVVPVQLQGGESIDLAGRRGATEADLAPDGTDPAFDPAFLVSHEDPAIDYGPVPGPGDGAASGNLHLMQLGLSDDLDRFVAALAAQQLPGRLRVVSAYTPGSGDAAAEGRALTLRHSRLTLARLGALAHTSGFDLVTMLPRAAGVRVTAAPGRMVRIAVAADSVSVGGTVALSVQPTVPAGATASWVVIAGGPGRADVTAGGTAGTATLTGRQPGDVSVGLDIVLGLHTVTVTTPITVQPVTLAAGTAIGADGTIGPAGDPGAVVGPPGATVDVRYLVTSSDAHANYTGGASSHLMQRGVAAHLTALLDVLDSRQVAGPLEVATAFQPAAGPPDLASAGRTLTVRHPTLAPGDLAAAAHIAGFGYAAVSGTDVILADADAELIAITVPDTVEEGASVTVTVDPDPASIGATTRLAWSSGGLDGGQAGLTSTTQPTAELVGIRAGLVWVQAVQREAGAAGPYCVQVRLRPELAAAGVTISREQYDLAMNVLHALHPLGVEVLTRDVRAAVVELAGAAELDPDYTYPRFRLHRPAALLRKDPSDG